MAAAMTPAPDSGDMAPARGSGGDGWIHGSAQRRESFLRRELIRFLHNLRVAQRLVRRHVERAAVRHGGFGGFGLAEADRRAQPRRVTNKPRNWPQVRFKGECGGRCTWRPSTIRRFRSHTAHAHANNAGVLDSGALLHRYFAVTMPLLMQPSSTRVRYFRRYFVVTMPLLCR